MLPALPRALFSRPAFALASAGLVAFLFAASATPGAVIGDALPGPTGNLGHAAANFLLAVFLLRSLVPLRSGNPGAAWPGLGSSTGRIVIAVVAVHALFDETHQFFVPGRTCSVIDIALDVLGAGAFLILPWPEGTGRPRGWWPVVAVGLAGVVLAVVGWLDRPFPDRLLEQVLRALS